MRRAGIAATRRPATRRGLRGAPAAGLAERAAKTLGGEQAAAREAFEETGLRVTLTRQFHTYSEPGRDPRQHTASTVFIATAAGTPQGGDDAARAEIFTKNTLPLLAFDHARILADYFRMKEGQISEDIF